MEEALERQLFKSIKDGNLNNIKILIMKGVNVNVVLKNGRTPLGVAAEGGCIPIINYLLSLNDSNQNGVLKMKNKSSVNNNNASESWKFTDDKRNLGYFVMVHDEDNSFSIGSKIFDGYMNENVCMNDIRTPDGMEGLEWDKEVDDDTFLPEDKEDVWSVQFRWYADILNKTCLIQNEAPEKCDINLQDVLGRTAVHHATERGHLDAVMLLISAGCNLSISDCENQTPLHRAAINGHVDIAEFLLSCGSGVNRKTSELMSPLHYAAIRGSKEMVLILLKYGANINSIDILDRTPLYIAVSKNKIEVVKVLIKYGAKVNMEDIYGSTALSKAVWALKIELVKLLLNSGAKIILSHHLLHYAIINRHHKMVELLLSAGTTVNLIDDNGDTPLIFAARTGDEYLGELIIKSGADVNLGNAINGNTPLHEAVKCIKKTNDFEKFVKLLLRHGAAINKQSGMFETALNHALILEKFKEASFLIKMGSDVNVSCINNYIRLHIDNIVIAKRKKQLSMVQMIILAGFNLQKLYIIDASEPEVEDDEIEEYIKYMKKNPLRLTEICRLCVRQNILSKTSKIIDELVEELPIPKTLKKYLLFEDIIIDRIDEGKNDLLPLSFRGKVYPLNDLDALAL